MKDRKQKIWMCGGSSVYLNPARGGNRKQGSSLDMCPPNVMAYFVGVIGFVLIKKL